MTIRKYQEKDREQIETIHFETGFMGKSMSSYLSNNKIWKNEIKYYFEKESSNIFVAEENKRIIGYILGCLDDKNLNETKQFLVMSFLGFFKSFFRKDFRFWKGQVKSIFNMVIGRSDELKFKIPENSGHIHINILPEFRGKNRGSKLLKTLEKHFKENGVKTIHADSFGTRLNPNQNFWLKNGFTIFSKVKTSIWKTELPKEKIFLICYKKELNN
jgi:GNAT superfamily N-acetyltransferase